MITSARERLTTDRGVRIIKHEAVADCGYFEVRFADGRESVLTFRREGLLGKAHRHS